MSSDDTSGDQRKPAEIADDIELTRDELARTVDQLSERVVAQTKQATGVAVKAAAAGAALVVVYAVVQRLRGRR